jgi:hypothetical protein
MILKILPAILSVLLSAWLTGGVNLLLAGSLFNAAMLGGLGAYAQGEGGADVKPGQRLRAFLGVFSLVCLLTAWQVS